MGRKSRKGRLFVINGISGTGVKSALGKYITWKRKITGDGKAPEVIDLQTFIMKAWAPYLKAVSAGPGDTKIDALLSLPKPALRIVWHNAFCEAIKAVKATMAKGKDVFLAFHACWYLQQTREYSSCVDLDLIRKMPKPAAVVTLVDDIYDVKCRLSRGGQLCAITFSEDPILDHILKLQLILTWRAFEIESSEHIARARGVSAHYVFATKHRLDVLDKLLYQPNLTKVYLAHSISQPRRLESKSPAESKRADDYKKELSMFAAQLRTSFVVFEPATIDELRLVNYGKQKKGQFLPLLTKRWPHDDEPEILWERPVSDDKPFGKEPERWITSRGKSKQYKARIDAIVPLMAALRDSIVRQINSRDHRYVEQSDSVVAFRPVFDGSSGGGVIEELRFDERLKKVGIARRDAIVYHPPTDEEKRLPLDIQELLTKWVGQGLLVSTTDGNQRKISLSLSKEIIEEAGKLGTDLGQLGNAIHDILKGHDWDVDPKVPRGALAVGRMRHLRKKLRGMAGEIMSIIESTYLSSISGVTFIRELMTPSSLAERIVAKTGLSV